ncbi:hypothetical protein [Methanoculleus chikugoensis]|uniref:hypothetical protein n=1 Tax=Methanoculleus chikugoensis TaxID=118126 RepID=UPI0006D07956|nr:hypothetical protein [Methanoculleus chikugoensis]
MVDRNLRRCIVCRVGDGEFTGEDVLARLRSCVSVAVPCIVAVVYTGGRCSGLLAHLRDTR